MTKKYFKYLLKDVMDLCQSEGLHQVDLLSPAAVRITEEEYRAQKRGQENLDKLNAEIRAAQMIPCEDYGRGIPGTETRTGKSGQA